MSTKQSNEPTVVTKEFFIEEYLSDQGYAPAKRKELPERVVKQLMREATKYAHLKMEEIEANHQIGFHHN